VGELNRTLRGWADYFESRHHLEHVPGDRQLQHCAVAPEVKRVTVGEGGGELGVECDRVIVVRNGALVLALGHVGETARIRAPAYLGSSLMASSKLAMAWSKSLSALVVFLFVLVAAVR
jgi:hypothetical protein